MSSPNANLKILDADTARVLQLERIDGEKVRAELKKHLVENEVVLFAHNSYYFTNGGRLIKIGENGSSVLLKYDEMELGDEVRTLPKLSFEAIMSKHVHQDALVLRSLVLASFVVKSLPECEALMGMTKEDAMEMRANRVNGVHTDQFKEVKKCLVDGESILLRSRNMYITSRGRAFQCIWDDKRKVHKIQMFGFPGYGLVSSMDRCRMPEDLVRKLMRIEGDQPLVNALITAAESIKVSEAISSMEVAKISKKRSAGVKRKHRD